MIIVGSQRGHAGKLAIHLTNGHNNEHVEVHQINGFMGQTVSEALHEIELISKGTKCGQYMFSVSFNPPDNVKASTRLFEKAIQRVGEKFGLDKQPHVIVFHEKQGRRHAHCVWSRIDIGKMKAINLPYFKIKLNKIGKAIFLEQGWDLPKGFIDRAKSNPLNYDLKDWQQARRQKRDPKEIKAILQQCWQDTANKAAFEKTIEQHGFYLACGMPRRGFVVVDWSGKVRSLSRQTGVKAKDLAVKFGPAENLPDVDTVQTGINEKLVVRLKAITEKLHQNHLARLAPYEQRKKQLAEEHAKAREVLQAQQQTNQLREAQERQQRLSKGIRRFWDMLTGRHKRTLRQNAEEEKAGQHQAQAERDKLRFAHLQERQILQQQIDAVSQHHEQDHQTLCRSVISQVDKTQRPHIEKMLAVHSQHLSV